ncbi:MAG: hypothetical protein WCF36_17155 [Candidatus Nanopelagicales bacterium]
MTLDLSFLSVRLGSMPESSRPVNVYEILRDGWRETRVDMTLQFFLDPNERHGLGSLVIDALLKVLDGAPTIGPAGRTETLFVAEDFQGSEAWEVSTSSARTTEAAGSAASRRAARWPVTPTWRRR